MQIVKILTFLTLSLFWDFTIRADIDYSQKSEFSGAYDKIKITNDGVMIGENATLYPTVFFNGIYLSQDLSLNFSKKALIGAKVTDIDSNSGEVFATSFDWYKNTSPGLFKITNNFQTIQKIGRTGYLNKVHIYKNKVYYGGNNYGAYVINRDGSNNIQLLGTDGYGPQIDQIKSNSKNAFILSRGSLYQVSYDKDSLTQILSPYRLNNIEPTDTEIYATATDRFLILDFTGKVLYEKSFQNQIRVFKKYLNYLFISEYSPSEQKIWISNDKGRTFYQSKTIFTSGNVIKEIELTGKENISIYLNFTNAKILKAKFSFDFEENKFLAIPFKYFKSIEVTDKITSFFDHRYPYLGNKVEPSSFSETTLNFYGDELKKPYIYYSSHDGVDFGLPINSEILAAEKGIASYYYNQTGLGHYIIISHPNNYLSVYGHLDEKGLVTKNTIEVSKGQVIGRVGMSGNTNGPHLHFTVYKGNKILENKVDPFGWKGNFSDPWNKSANLWDLNVTNLNSDITLNNNSLYSLDNLELKFDTISNENTYHLTFFPVSPVFDRLNFKYIEKTSYKLELSNLLNEKVISFASLRFNGFKSFEDEKRFSIFKYNGESLIKLETLFDEERNTLSTYTNVDGQYMVLENGYKKITTKSNFKTTE